MTETFECFTVKWFMNRYLYHVLYDWIAWLFYVLLNKDNLRMLTVLRALYPDWFHVYDTSREKWRWYYLQRILSDSISLGHQSREVTILFTENIVWFYKFTISVARTDDDIIYREYCLIP